VDISLPELVCKQVGSCQKTTIRISTGRSAFKEKAGIAAFSVEFNTTSFGLFQMYSKTLATDRTKVKKYLISA